MGAFGAALGAFGGAFSALGIVAWRFPEFAKTAPDWFFLLFVIGMIVLVGGAWPALDWLVNHHPGFGGPVLALVGLALIALGVVTILWTAWGATGWMAAIGGVLMLPASYLALVGGGTEPLTWRSLRTERVQAVEARLNPLVDVVFAVVGVVSFGLLIFAALEGGDWLTLGTLAVVGLVGCGWLLLRRRR